MCTSPAKLLRCGKWSKRKCGGVPGFACLCSASAQTTSDLPYARRIEARRVGISSKGSPAALRVPACALGLEKHVFFLENITVYVLLTIGPKPQGGVDAVLCFCLLFLLGEGGAIPLEWRPNLPRMLALVPWCGRLRQPPKCASASDHRHLLAEEVKATPARSRRSSRRWSLRYRRRRSVP